MAALALAAVSSVAAMVVPARATGAPLHVIAPSVSAFSSDGVREVAWQTGRGGPIEVLDTATNRRSTVLAPAGCRLLDEGEGGTYNPTGAAGRFLLECAATGAILDSRTGNALPMPAGTSWYRLGTRYARGNDAREKQIVEDLATGAIRRVRDREPVDLDRPGAPGEKSICPRLRSAVRRAGIELMGDFSYRDGLFVHRFGAHGMVRLERCRRRPMVLRSQYTRHEFDNHAPRSFDLRGGLLTWDSGISGDTIAEPDSGRPCTPSRLFALKLRSHRMRSWRLPRISVADGTEGPIPCSYGYSAHTAGMVFWIATRTLAVVPSGAVVATMSVYAARL